MRTTSLLCALALPALIAACTPCRVCVPATTVVPTSVSAGSVSRPATILATGYGATVGNGQATAGQQRLMAMRAARLDAYRNLAEQVYGFRVWSNTAVSAFATQNDSIRSYVDAYIRGARLVNMTALGDGSFEATVELELTAGFIQCVSGPAVGTASCAAALVPVEASCANFGCSQPGGYYYTVE